MAQYTSEKMKSELEEMGIEMNDSEFAEMLATIDELETVYCSHHCEQKAKEDVDKIKNDCSKKERKIEELRAKKQSLEGEIDFLHEKKRS